MEITEIKAQLPISNVLHHYNLKADRNNRMQCPFHDDKTPSMQIYPKTNTAYCFSSNCKTHGKSMDVIDFILHKESCTKHEAIVIAGQLLGEAPATPKSQTVADPVPTTDAGRIEVLTKLFDTFQKGALSSGIAKQYLNSRCINLENIQLGYNSGQFHHNKKNTDMIESCVEYGLLRQKEGKSRTGGVAYQVFAKGCIAFALRNATHKITGLYFRSTSDVKGKTHFYLKNRQGLYPHYPVPQATKLILTESVIDAATLMQMRPISSAYAILALYGVNGLTKEHLQAIRGAENLEEVIFFLDGDEAGKKAVDKYAPMLKKELPRLQITHVVTPPERDINSLVQLGKQDLIYQLLDKRTPFFSIEKKVLEKPSVITPSRAAKPDSKADLDTTNPHNIKYSGLAADYQIKGFVASKGDQLDSLKISLQIIDQTSGYDHRAKLDLYEYKQIKSVCNAAAERLSLRYDLLEKDLCRLTNLLEVYRTNKEENKAYKSIKVIVPQLTASKCIEFLKRPNLIKNINELIGKAGITGEEENRILLFVIASSYKMPDTLHALIQGSSGSGKTRLMKIISDLMPPEDVKRYTRVTDNSFYNQDEYFFVHKLICFEDLDGLKEEAQLAVRELQSNEILRTSTSIKDASGSIRGGERIVRGPIASLSCTTKGETYEDNVSRSFLIAVDESGKQTLLIIEYQNEVAAGLIDKSEQIKAIHFLQNCIRLLQPYEVINPFASKIKLPREAHKIRRLNELYQSFVRQITLLNQHQRKQDKQGRLISEKQDLQVACDILFESILLKVDELDGSLRQFFEKLKKFVNSKGQEYEFNRFEVRSATGVSKTQQHYYIQKLVEMEYLKQFGFANRGYRYKISHWDNIAMIRSKIKESLKAQLDQL